MKNHLIYYTALVGSLSMISPAFAENNDLSSTDDIDEITVTGAVSTFGALKSDIPILETARSIKVITSDEFLERGALTLDDTLNYTAGVVGDTYGFATRGDFPTVRGLSIPEYLDNVQVLFGYYNNARSDVYTLEQVEVLKGPASVLYGQGSPGGILNTISKKASSDYLGQEITAEYGTHDRFQIATDLGFDLSGDETITARLVAVYRNSGTQVDYVEDDVLVIAPSVTYENEGTKLTALVNYTEHDSDTAQQFLPHSVTGCASDQVTITGSNACLYASGQEVSPTFYAGDPTFNKYDTKSLSVTLFAEQEITESISFEGTARYRDAEADYNQVWTSFAGAGVPRTLTDGTPTYGRTWYKTLSTSEQFAADTRLRGQFATDNIDHEILVGVNYQQVNTSTKAAYLSGIASTFSYFSPVYDGSEVPSDAIFEAYGYSTENHVKTLGAYVSYQMEVENFILNAGLRYDDMETDNGTIVQDDSATSFSFGGLYKTDFGLNPYVSYAESFQTVVGNDGETNAPLKPQKGKQIEVGLKFHPEGSRTYITVAYFDIKQSNLSNPGALVGAPTQQEGIAKIKGVEFEARAAIGDFFFDGNVSSISTKDPDGIRFSAAPNFQASVWATWRPSDADLEGLRIGLGVRHVGNNVSESGTVKIETDGYTLFDALIGYKIGKIDFTLNGRNLFNKEYYATCLARGDCFTGEARTIVLRAAYNF